MNTRATSPDTRAGVPDTPTTAPDTHASATTPEHHDHDHHHRAPDPIASLTLALVGALALAASWVLPWWTMEARAPQYGQRVLVIQVSPRAVGGDVFEVDTLGHYVGIRPTTSLARLERKLAPVGLLAALVGLAVVPWLPGRRLRGLAILPAVLMPILFLGDLYYWMNRSVNDRDPDASLNLIISNIAPKLLGQYDVAQFQIRAAPDTGLYLASFVALLALGLAFAVPLGRPRPLPRRYPIVAAAFGLLLAALGTRPAAAAERRLAAGETIAAAVAAADPGDELWVPEGVHREHLVLRKRITLRGRPGAVIDGSGEGTVIRIEAPGVEIHDLEVRGSGDGYTAEDAGIRIQDAAGVVVARTRIEDSLFGLFLVHADRTRIEDSVVIGKDLPITRRGDGIRLWYSSDCVLTGNRVEKSRDVIIWYSSGTRVEDNEVRHGRYGLHYMYSDRNAFHRNRFEDNETGATIMYSRGIELSQNSFSFSRGVGGYGLLIKDADDIAIRDNRFVGNATALFIDGAPQARDGWVRVRGNLIARNDTGITLQPLSRNIELWENAFIGNGVQVQIAGTGGAGGNTWAVGGRGNFWSDAVIYDTDGDGVSEIPYSLESTYEALADRHPVLGFFAGTPGAEAIDFAARLFPIFAARPRMSDPHPLAEPGFSDWMRQASDRKGGALLPAAGVLMLAAAAGLARGAGRAF